MTSWNLTIDNRNNASTTVYVMEDDKEGIFNTPDDLHNIWRYILHSPAHHTAVVKRYLNHLVIGGDNFPSPCQEISGGNRTGRVRVLENTKRLKCWTYTARTSTWNIAPNLDVIDERTAIAIPRI